MDLHERIRAWREHVGLRVTDLAERVDVSTSAVCQWEQEKDGTEPSHDNLAKIVDALGISMAKFWGPIPRKKSS